MTPNARLRGAKKPGISRACSAFAAAAGPVQSPPFGFLYASRARVSFNAVAGGFINIRVAPSSYAPETPRLHCALVVCHGSINYSDGMGGKKDGWALCKGCVCLLTKTGWSVSLVGSDMYMRGCRLVGVTDVLIYVMFFIQKNVL